MENYEHYFKDHILTKVSGSNTTNVFVFRNANGDINCMQRWIIDKGTLIVLGDNYSSIYKWNDSNITLDFLANCNLGYFNSKCLADKDGYGQKVYSPERAQIYLKEIVCDNIFEQYSSDEDVDFSNWETMDISSKFKTITPIISRELEIDDYEVESFFYLENEYEAYEMLSDSKNEFLFGFDGWELAKNIMTYTMTPQMHLTALRIANSKFPNFF